MSSFKEERAYCFAAVHRQSVSWSVHPQFPFSFFAEVAHTEMQFCIQIYEEYLGQVGFFAISIHFHFRGLKGRGHKCFTNISCLLHVLTIRPDVKHEGCYKKIPPKNRMSK